MEAFLYCWTNITNNRMYIGSHVGTENDGYICSSKSMLKEYKDHPNNFIRTIIAHGSEEDIRNLETTILYNLDAANNTEFYNLNNHAYPQKSGWKHTNESKVKIGATAKGRKHSDRTKAKLSKLFKDNPPGPAKHSNKTKRKMSASHIGNLSNTGKMWINNGKKSMMIDKQTVIPEGFVKGRGKFYGELNSAN